MLNIIFASFFILSFISVVFQAIFYGDFDVINKVSTTILTSSKDSFYIALNLTGMLCFWLGILKIGQEAGITQAVAKLLQPLFLKIMPEVPKGHKSLSSIVMNIAANILGLDNAATPMGIKAMEQLQEINKKKDEASNAQILFIVTNSAAVTLIPISILLYRQTLGASNPMAVFLPILLATSVSSLVGFLAVAYKQRLNIFNRVVGAYLGGYFVFIALLVFAFYSMNAEQKIVFSSIIGNGVLLLLITSFILYGLLKRQNVYENFISGAKEGFDVAIKIIPYLVALLVAIAVFRASGVLDFVCLGFEKFFVMLGVNTDFVPALPTALLKPLSGSGARAAMIETMQAYGANSFPAFVSTVVQGSTETTFYVIALYFGAIKIVKTRYALSCALLADLAGIIAAISLSYLFY
ncbi:MAG: nucleoside recognition domain-containing protein [Alphaproteobacteria bacterium]